MIIKSRLQSLELQLFRSLHARMDLSPKDTNYHSNLEKGYNGEVEFDKLFKGIADDWLILNDLLLECSNTTFQIDSLLISAETIYLFEVKNFEGDYFIEGDRWYAYPKTEIKNPLLQLKRSESLLRRTLQDLGIKSTLEAYVIFVNPQFTLYQAPLNLPIIFPSQIKRFVDKLKSKPSRLQDRHTKLAEQLVSASTVDSHYSKVPEYGYEHLRKGILCSSCFKFVSEVNLTVVKCNTCNAKEDLDLAVLRSVEEFNRLFPEKLITTEIIHEWCGAIKSKKTIRRILSAHFERIGVRKGSYYEPRVLIKK